MQLMIMCPIKTIDRLKEHVEKYMSKVGRREVAIEDLYSSKPPLNWIYEFPTAIKYDSCETSVDCIKVSPYNNQIFCVLSGGNLYEYGLHDNKQIKMIEQCNSMSWLR